VLEVIKNLRSNNGVVSNKSALDEGTLKRANHIRENLLNSIGQGFSYDLKSHITERNGSKVTRGGVGFYFWDEADESGV
jgi:hypothetical protein